MARFNEKKLPYATQDRLMNSFCEMLNKLKGKEVFFNFLKDLLNRQERIMLIRRLRIAELLLLGKKYWQIREEMHCGFGTIARVQRWLNFGRNGYRAAIKELQDNAIDTTMH